MYAAKWAILSKIFCCSLNVLLFPIWTCVCSHWNIKAHKMVFLCQNLGERIKQQRIIVASLDSLFQSVLSPRVPSFFVGGATFIAGRAAHHQITHWSSWSMNIHSHSCQITQITCCGIFAASIFCASSRGNRWYTQSSTNPAGTKLTCFWRIPIQQLFAPGGCGTFDPILAGAWSDLQCWVLRAVCPELALIMSWAFLLSFLSSFSLLSLVQMYSLPKTMSNKLPLLFILMCGFIGDVCALCGQRRVSVIVWFPGVL